jgi:hypothetical protein
LLARWGDDCALG